MENKTQKETRVVTWRHAGMGRHYYEVKGGRKVRISRSTYINMLNNGAVEVGFNETH